MPKKPIKWGIKLWCLCDSNTGYCVAFNVYCGSDREQGVNLDLGYKVVMRLMRDYLQKYHHVYADNYFTSVHLADALLQADTYLCGTTRATRKEFPKSLAATRLKAGESVKWTNETGVMLCKWHDKRDVHMISTNDAGGDHVIHVRRKRQEVDLSVPTCVRSYNASMGGVDHLDQLRSYYGIGRSGRRWWKYIFWGIINIGVINAYILWTLCNRPLPANVRLYSLKAFKLRLIHNMTDATAQREQLPTAINEPDADLTVSEEVVDGHPLVRFVGRKRTCHMCSRQHKKTAAGRYVETKFGCFACKVYLCKSGPCFLEYHA